jgi:transglutaminase-like putative cysteine protease
VTERHLVRAAEVGLVCVTLAAVLGMARLFAGGTWIGPLVANAIAAHGLAIVLRRRGIGLGLSTVAMAGGAALVTTWSCYWSTTVAGIPTGRTLSLVGDDLTTSWHEYQHVDAPAAVLTGYLVASALAIWVIAYVADWAAFRLWVPFESTLPAGTLVLFASLIGADRGRAWAVAVYAATLLLFLLVHRVARQDGTSHWVAERRTAGHRSLLTAGACLAALAVVVGAVIGPVLPGADAAGVLDPHDLDGNDAPRVTISPLVDIRSRLVDQANVEVFDVHSTARSYWRLTSLERFDGRIWSSSGSYGKAKGGLPEAVPIDAATQEIDQTFDITALAAIWLPSAYEARSFQGEDIDARFDEDSSTLIVSSKVTNSDGLSYQVRSTSPRLTPADLTGTAREVPKGIRNEYGGLPKDFSPRVAGLARTITQGATTPYAQAKALQDFLRTFTYDLSAPSGHSDDALESFLFETKRGYCEQFAGAYAAMARSIGLPARVAVGFTPGEQDPTDPTLFRVRGENAHAWPEVYFAGAGWVAFEPTPGRGMPGAEPYTGVPEQQAATGQPSTATTLTTTVPGGPTGTTPDTTPGGRSPQVDAGSGAGQGDRGDQGGDSLVERYAVHPARTVLPFLVGLVLLYLLGVPAVLLVHRRRRRARAGTADQRIALAWIEAVEGAQLVGFRERPSDTYAERAAHLAEVLPTATLPAEALALARERADYSPEGAGPAEVASAEAASADVVAAARELTPRSARVLRWLDPRQPLTVWRHARAAQRRQIATVASGSRDLDLERVP